MTFWVNIGDGRDIASTLNSTLTTGLISTFGGNDGVKTAIARALYQESNLTLKMETIALSMTKAIREGPNATTFKGTVSVPDQRIVVRWAWMTLPVSLVVSSAVFLIATMTFATEKNSIAWKSSSLPILYHGIYDLEESVSDCIELQDMSRKAKDMWASSESRPGGTLKLVQS
jgi:hypothetical protein